MPPRGVSTPKSRAAARKNGIKGAKHGKEGGRPGSSKLPEDLRELHGEPPLEDPLEMARWWQRGIVIYHLAEARGVRGIKSEADRYMRKAKASADILQHDIIFSAATALKNNEDDQEHDAGGELVDRTEASE